MDDLQQLAPWLVLQKIPGMGLAGIHRLLARFQTPLALLQAGSALQGLLTAPQYEQFTGLQHAGNSHPVWQQVNRELDYLAAHDIHAITLHSVFYPLLLKETCHPPLVLYVRGDPALLSCRQLAVVGSRQAGKLASDIALQWSDELAQAGLAITSGLALGIDGAAHAGALQNQGKTIAVLAHGLDHIYPHQHRDLAEQVAASGALVSEFAIGTAPKRENFPRRNRVISGLSQGVLVIEAAIKSGSLITARYALEQNREVFAVPGSIANPMVKGCHALIKEGAYLVESTQEILDILGWQTARQAQLPWNAQPRQPVPASAMANTGHLPETAQLLLQAIPFELIHPDELMTTTGLGIAELTQELVMLELDGYIEVIAGNCRRLR